MWPAGPRSGRSLGILLLVDAMGLSKHLLLGLGTSHTSP